MGDDAFTTNADGSGRGGPPNFAAAAETLGICEQALRDVLGGSPPDFAAAAEALGVGEEEIRVALDGE